MRQKKPTPLRSRLGQKNGCRFGDRYRCPHFCSDMLEVSMRHARLLLLVAILAILGGLGTTYYARLKLRASTALTKPAELPPGTLGQTHAFTYTHTSNQ